MKRKIIVFVDDNVGYKIKLKWGWKKMWKTLPEDEQRELDKVFNKMYLRYCKLLHDQLNSK